MKYVTAFFLLTACTAERPTPQGKERGYCIDNGGSSFQPKCKYLEKLQWGIVVRDCHSGPSVVPDIINPTNVTECEL